MKLITFDIKNIARFLGKTGNKINKNIAEF